MTESKQVWFTTYTHNVIEHMKETGQLVLVPDTDKHLVRSCLERVLVSNKDLLVHVKVLIHEWPVHEAFSVDSGTYDNRAMIYEKGLKILDDQDLVELLTNPLLLLKLSDEIYRKMPVFWQTIMDRESIHYVHKRKFCL